MSTDELKLGYRDARDQLQNALGMGVNYPLAEVPITTQNTGEFTNTPTIRFSKVDYASKEEVYVHTPQENCTYALIDVESNVVVDSVRTPPDLHSSLQSTLTLKTSPVDEVERTFKIRATEHSRELVREMDAIVKVRAGINVALPVQLDRAIINFGETVTVSILHAQADCEYYLVAGDAKLGQAQTPLSSVDYSKKVRTAVVTSVVLNENTDFKVYARFRTSEIDGYLSTPLHVDVKPNTHLAVSAVENGLTYCTQKLVDDGKMAAVIAQVAIQNTQASADYTLYFDWVDPVVAMQRVGEVGSHTMTGTNGELIVPLNQILPEDVSVLVKATNRESGLTVTLVQNLRFKIKPSTRPTLHARTSPIASGEEATIEIHNPQVGAYYQLHKAGNHHPVGMPQYMTKSRPIEIAKIEVDLAVAPNPEQLASGEASTEIVILNGGAITSNRDYYVKVRKPINDLPPEKLDETISVQVSA